MESPLETLPHVVVLGGGFGGLAAARALKRAPVRVTLIDRTNHHVFQPLLYEVATAGLEASDIGYPLRSALRRQPNTGVLMVEAASIDSSRNAVELESGQVINYDYLIVATGAETSYFGHPEWRSQAPGLKTLQDALDMRCRVLSAFEQAEQARDPAEQRALLTFVVVGGGPTGVELAGAVAELAKHALRRDFRHIDTTKSRIIMVEGGPAILPTYPVSLQRKALQQLTSMGVEVRTSALVSGVDAFGVTIGEEQVTTRTVLWAAGVSPTKIVRSLGAPLDRRGRVPVTTGLNPPKMPNIFIVGDLAALEQDGRLVPGVATAAIQEGRYAARAIVHALSKRPLRPFRYRNKGELAIIGRSRAVGLLPGNIKLSGLIAWLGYLAVHLFYLVGFRSRVSVFVTWVWSYLTFGRGARLIPTASAASPRPEEGGHRGSGIEEHETLPIH